MGDRRQGWQGTHTEQAALETHTNKWGVVAKVVENVKVVKLLLVLLVVVVVVVVVVPAVVMIATREASMCVLFPDVLFLFLSTLFPQ